jgi:hypothetical protein
VIRNPEQKRPLGDRRRWKDRIKMYVKEMGHEGVNWIKVTRDTLRWFRVKTIMNFRVPKIIGKFLKT